MNWATVSAATSSFPWRPDADHYPPRNTVHLQRAAGPYHPATAPDAAYRAAAARLILAIIHAGPVPRLHGCLWQPVAYADHQWPSSSLEPGGAWRGGNHLSVPRPAEPD